MGVMGGSNLDLSSILQLLRICIVTEDKETIDVIVNEDDTVWSLKIRLFEHTGLFPGKQSISFKTADEANVQLQNDKTIREYNLKSGQQLFLARAASQHESKSSSSRGGGFLGLLTKKVGFPKLCFGVGRALKKAVVGWPCTFNLHKVDSRGKQIKSDDDFEIEIIHKKDNSKDTLHFCDFIQRAGGIFSTVIFTPVKNGEYRIHIKLDGVDISGSPFRSHAIDENSPKIKELAFNLDWVPEITQLYSLLAQRAETVDSIFQVGHEGLLHLMRNGSRQVQSDMTSVFAFLLKKDDNKGRLVREMGLSLLKLLKTDYWMGHLEIKCFVARFLVILAISEENCIKMLDEVGTLPLAGLARTQNPECSRGCAKVLCLMSEHLSTRLRLVKDTVFSIMYHLMQQEDIVTTYDTFFAVANLCHIDDAQNLMKENMQMVVFIVSKVNSENMHLRMQSLKILSILTTKAEFATRLFSCGLHNVVVQHAEGFMAGLVFEWETQAARYLYAKNEKGEDDPKLQEGMVRQLKSQFKDDLGCSQYSAIILANMHQHNIEEMGAFIVKGACLRMLRRMARSADIVTQIEACKILTTLSSPDQPQEVKDALVVGGMVVALLQAITIDKPVLLGHIMITIANICKYNRSCLESVSPAELDKLIEVLLRGGPATERNACLILGNMVAIDKYRSKIVNTGGHVFFTHLIELVRVGELDLLPEIEQSELRVIKKIGKGVSGVVWKAEWKGLIVAVKSFNESNIAFNVDEFASEMALMSVLRHNNVMHCLGGSRWAKKLFLVSEYFAKGSLYDLLHKRKIRLSLERILQIATDTAAGLNYLHSLGLIHRDIKTGNLLIAHDWTVKIGDFGVSRVVAKRMTRAVGTPCYMAPEVLEGQEYTQAADVYSYAFVLWEMVSRETPFKDIPHLEMAKLVVEDKQRPTLPDNCPDSLKELVELCWHPVPSKRPAMGDVLVFLQNIRSGFTEDQLSMIVLPGVADEDEDDDDTSSNDSTEPTEILEHEKEWELLCQQYKREKNKLKQKEGVKSKGRSDSVFKSSSGSKKDSSKALTLRDSDAPVTPSQALPSTPTFEPPPPFLINTDDTPIGRPRSYSALPLIRIPQAGDPIPVSPIELPRMSPLARDANPNTVLPPRSSPRTQLDVFVEMMVRGAQSVVPPANMEVIIDEAKKDERPPRPPRSHPSSPAIQVTVKEDEEGSKVFGRSNSDSSAMPTIAEEAPPSPTRDSASDGAPSPLPAPREVDLTLGVAENASPFVHEESSPSLESGYPIEQEFTITGSGEAPMPPPRRNIAGDSPQRASSRHTLRHQHVPSPKLYRSNTAILPQNRSLTPHKSFTTPVVSPAPEHFTNVVLKPSPHRPPDVQWVSTDSRYPFSPREGESLQLRGNIQGHPVEAELSRGKSESSGLIATGNDDFNARASADSITQSRVRSNSDGTRSRSNSMPQKPVLLPAATAGTPPPTKPEPSSNSSSNGAISKSPPGKSASPKIEPVSAVDHSKKVDRENSPSAGITRRSEPLRESCDSTREIFIPIRDLSPNINASRETSSDSLHSWNSNCSKSIKSSSESAPRSGATSASTSIANSIDSLKNSTDSVRGSAEVKRGPTASDLVKMFASMGGSSSNAYDAHKSSPELSPGKRLLRKTSADTLSNKETAKSKYIRKTSSDSINTVTRSSDAVLGSISTSPVVTFKDMFESLSKSMAPLRPSGHIKKGSEDSALNKEKEKEKEREKEKGGKVGRSDSSPSFVVPHASTTSTSTTSYSTPSSTSSSPVPEEKPHKQNSTRRFFSRS